MITSHEKSGSEALVTAEAAPWSDVIMSEPSNAELKGTTFITTVRGKIVQHLPLTIESGGVVFYGLVFGLDSLFILAAAILNVGTPFYMYFDSMAQGKRHEALKKVNLCMTELSKGCNSDLIASLYLMLQYKELKLDSLSERAEQAWCDERCASKIRLETTLQVEAQIKVQLEAQISFVDISDVNALREQLDANNAVVALICTGPYLQRALFVQHDKARAQREKRVGPSIFLGLHALQDNQIGTCCPWSRNSVVIPHIVNVRYQRLLGTFATQMSQPQFNILMLLLLNDLVFEERGEYVLFGLQLQETRLLIRCSFKTAATVLHFRKAVSLKMSLLRFCVEEKVTADNTERLNEFMATRKPLPGIASALDVSNFLLHAMKVVLGSSLETMDCTPCQNIPDFKPTSHSMMLSNSDCLFAYVSTAETPWFGEDPDPDHQMPVFHENDDEEP